MASTTCSRSLTPVGSSTCLLERESAVTRATLFRASSPPGPALSTRAVAAPVARQAVRVLALSTETEAEEGVSPGVVAEGSKLYVGNLPWNVDSASLAEIFQDAGVVEEVEVIVDRDSGRSRGFAFVVMSSPEEAQAAIERFDGSDLGGRTLRVNFPAPPGERRERTRDAPRGRDSRGPPRGDRAPREENPNKLYVGNLSWGVDDLALQDLFTDFGKVVEARVVTDRETGRSRGFGFVTLSNQDEVSQAVSNLDGAEYDGRQLRVNPAGQKPGF